MDDRLRADIEDIEEEIRRYVLELLVNRKDSPARRDLQTMIRASFAEELGPELRGMREDLKELTGILAQTRDLAGATRQQIATAIQPVQDQIDRLANRLDVLGSEATIKHERPPELLRSASSQATGRGRPAEEVNFGHGQVAAGSQSDIDRVTRVVRDRYVSGGGFGESLWSWLRGHTEWVAAFVCTVALALAIVSVWPLLPNLFGGEPGVTTSSPDRSPPDQRSDEQNSDNQDAGSAPQIQSGARQDTGIPDENPSNDARRALDRLINSQIMFDGQRVKLLEQWKRICREQRNSCLAPAFPTARDASYAGLVIQFGALSVANRIKCPIGITSLDGEMGPATQSALRELRNCLQERIMTAQPPCEESVRCTYPGDFDEALRSRHYTSVLNWLLPLTASTPK